MAEASPSVINRAPPDGTTCPSGYEVKGTINVVKMLKTDETAINDVHLGDHVALDGEKVHEQLFKVQQHTVNKRYTKPLTNTDKHDKEKNG